MSIKVMSAVWERSQHAGTELLMLLALADFSDDRGSSYPGVTALAEKCRMKPRNANYILATLQKSGELQVLVNEGPKGTNRYRIVLEALGGVQGVAGVGVQPGAGVQGAAGLQSSVDTPAMECAKPLQPVAAEPSLNRQEPSERVRARRKAMPEDFDQAVSQRVRGWAARKGFGDLDAHLEHFVGKARANGYTYVNWDDALMNAIRDDWAKLRTGSTHSRGGRGPVLSSDDVFEGAR